MKVIVCSSAAHPTPPLGYGSEVTAWYVAQTLAERGHEVLLVAAQGSRCPQNGKLLEMRRDLERSGEAEREAIPRLQPLLEGFDVLHDMSSSHCFADAAHESTMDRHLCTINGISFHTPFHKHNVCVLSRAAQRAALNGTPAFGPEYPELANDPGRLPSCEIVHYGTDTDFYRPLEQVRGDYVLYVGRPHPSKGVHRILALARMMPTTWFVLAWHAEYPEHQGFDRLYRSQAEGLGNVAIIDLPMRGHHEAKRALYQHARCFLQPTEYIEAFGLTAIEALACGTPIVLAKRGSAEEIVIPGVTGRLCGNDEEFVQAIDTIDGIDRGYCRHDARKRFDRNTMVDRYLALYAKAMRGETW